MVKIIAHNEKDKKQALILEKYINSNKMLKKQLESMQEIIYMINNHNMIYGSNLSLNQSLSDIWQENRL